MRDFAAGIEVAEVLTPIQLGGRRLAAARITEGR
jgi:hypothetical protein